MNESNLKFTRDLIGHVINNMNTEISNGNLSNRLAQIQTNWRSLSDDEKHELGTLKLSVPNNGNYLISLANISLPIEITFSGKFANCEIENCNFLSLSFLEHSFGKIRIFNNCNVKNISIRSNGEFGITIEDTKIEKMVLSDIRSRSTSLLNCITDNFVVENLSLESFGKLSDQSFKVTERIFFKNCSFDSDAVIFLDEFQINDQRLQVHIAGCTGTKNVKFSTHGNALIELNIISSKFNSGLSFHDFSNSVGIKIKDVEINNRLSLQNVHLMFKKEELDFGISFDNVVVHGDVHVSDLEANCALCFSGLQASANLKIERVKKSKAILFQAKSVIGSTGLGTKIFVNDCENFFGILVIDSIVNSEIEIFNSTLEVLYVEKSTFNGDILIHSKEGAKHSLKCRFWGSEFAKNLELENYSILACDVVNSTINGYFRFKNIVFEKPPHIHGAVIKTYLGLVNPDISLPKEEPESYIEDFRSLKQIMKSQGNDKYEMEFSALELDCRLSELKSKKVKTDDNKFEITVLKAYEFLNEKGRSLIRPLWIWVGQLVSVFTIFFIVGCLEKSKYTIVEIQKAPYWIKQLGDGPFALAIVKSLQNSIGAIGLVFDVNIDFHNENVFLTLGVKFLSVVQILLSTLLIYLILAGIKRRIRTS